MLSKSRLFLIQANYTTSITSYRCTEKLSIASKIYFKACADLVFCILNFSAKYTIVVNVWTHLIIAGLPGGGCGGNRLRRSAQTSLSSATDSSFFWGSPDVLKPNMRYNHSLRFWVYPRLSFQWTMTNTTLEVADLIPYTPIVPPTTNVAAHSLHKTL